MLLNIYPLPKCERQVFRVGYKYIEQSPHPRINPFYKRTLKAGRDTMQEYKRALQNTAWKSRHLLWFYRWSAPMKASARRGNQLEADDWIAVDMGVQVINTELSGTPDEPEICEEMWYRSMEELLPIVDEDSNREFSLTRRFLRTER